MRFWRLFFCCVVVYACQWNGPVQEFPYALGELRMNKQLIQLDTVRLGGERVDTLIVYNPTREVVRLESVGRPDGIVCRHQRGSLSDWQFGGITIPAGGRDTLCLGVKAEREDQLGDFFAFVRFMMNGKMSLACGVEVKATVMEDFTAWDEERKKQAPRVWVDTTTRHFGEIASGEKVSVNFKLSNVGKRDLQLRKVVSTCGCTVPVLEQKVIASGDTMNLKVTFDATGRWGMQRKEITVICNDPERPQLKLVVKGYVRKE